MPPLNIRDPRAAELAKKLAARRNTSMTKAIIDALHNELARDAGTQSLECRMDRIVDRYVGKSAGQGRDLTPAQIDEMWGH